MSVGSSSPRYSAIFLATHGRSLAWTTPARSTYNVMISDIKIEQTYRGPVDGGLEELVGVGRDGLGDGAVAFFGVVVCGRARG